MDVPRFVFLQFIYYADMYTAIQSQNTVKPNPLCRLPLDEKFRGSRRNGIWAKGDVTACRGRHGEVGIVDWALLCFGFLWQYYSLLNICERLRSRRPKRKLVKILQGSTRARVYGVLDAHQLSLWVWGAV